MDLKDFLANIKDEPSDIIERKLNELVRENYHFQHLSSENKEIVLALVKRYKEKLRTGKGVSQYVINRDMYKLYRQRYDLKLTEVDCDHIREILESFK
ncbi:MAG TPA: hypothetical protein PLA05_01960 [bacterium]|jgi:hypothetical protein|nr:MAG: hypothetical protein BWX82_00651 [Parcubacteria group bacterium ADurb.Bin115]HNU81118.1 hypothetical protein [bacterium]HOD86732.1 hypothetical protein [bacterium]HPW05708.1 hypothetical protein [bacterium]HPY99484.1 hypothetical protein [bacterium]